MVEINSNGFNWRDHVNIRSDVSPSDREQIEKTLDAIAAAHDSEGQELIRKAEDTHNKIFGGKLTISVAPGKGSVVDSDGIRIDPAQLAKLRYYENGIYRPTSLTGLAVHELYHKADAEMTLGSFQKIRGIIADSARPTEDLSPERREEYLNIMAEAVEGLPAGYIVSALQNPTIMDVILKHRNPGLPPDQVDRIVGMIDPQKTKEELIARCILYPNGTIRTEENAVHFTDAFMKKNFGSQEPQREKYENYFLTGEDQALKNPFYALDLSGIPLPTKGFKALECPITNLGDFGKPPEVKPHQPEQAAPTRFQ